MAHWSGQSGVDSAEVQREKTDYIRRLLNRKYPVAEIRRMITADHRFNQTPNADTIKKIKDPNFVLSVRGQGGPAGMDEKTLLSYVSDEIQNQYKIGNLTFKELQQKSYNARDWRLTVEAVDAFGKGTATPEQEERALKRFEDNKRKSDKARIRTQIKNQSGESLAAQYSNLTTRNAFRNSIALMKGREFQRDIEGLSWREGLKMGRDWFNDLTDVEQNRLLSKLAKSTEYSEGQVLEQLGSEFPELADVTVFHHWKGIKEGGGAESLTAIPESFHKWWHGKQGPLGDPSRSRHARLNELLDRFGVMDYDPYRTRTTPTGETISGTPPFLRSALEKAGLGDLMDTLYKMNTELASPELISQQQSALRHPSIDASFAAQQQIRNVGMQPPPQNILSSGSEAYRKVSRGGGGAFNPKLSYGGPYGGQGLIPAGSVMERQLRKRLR